MFYSKTIIILAYIVEPDLRYLIVQMIDYPYLNEVKFERNSEQPVFLQIARSLAALIKGGIIKPGQKLPGSRKMAEMLKVNRNTISLATDELLTEGWVISRPKSGLFINAHLPVVQPHPHFADDGQKEERREIDLQPNLGLEAPELTHLRYEFNDGIPDPRLSPLNELGREYHKLLKKSAPLKLFGYAEAQGEPFLRKILSRDLNENRCLKTSDDTIFITRGSIMAISLITQALVKKGDGVAVGTLSYRTGNLIFEHAGARLIKIPVDEKGIDTGNLEAVLEKEKIKMLYVTSHHHHPTTVTLAPERRVHVYELAKKWGFLILEDDYDFDFHYENRPTLPIASMDTSGLVAYIGSWSKTMFPGIRTGFVAAPKALIQEMTKYRRIMDRQGDHVMERAIANLMYDGTMQRYLRKSKKIYAKRKVYFCQRLRSTFSEYLHFTEPEGGMAVWVQFKEGYPLPEISRRCRQKGLYISDGRAYNSPDEFLNYCRLGFTHMNEEEIDSACGILKEVLEGMEDT